MLRKYIDSLIIVRYMALVFITAAVTLGLAMVYNFAKIEIFSTLTILAGVAEFVMILLFAVERARSARQLVPVKRKEDFNEAVLIGPCMLIEKRMLAYKNGRVIESDYTNVREASLIGSPGRHKVRMAISGDTFDAEVRTRENAELLAGFLKAKNPNIVFRDLEPRGKGVFRALQPLSQERPK